jgi:hypothetical protein
LAIINSSKKFIFVHVPKAAGTSVTNALSKYTTIFDAEIGGTHFGESVQPFYKKRFGISKHSPASDIKSAIGEEIWDDFFKFSIVRNPYTRAISTYKFLLKWEGTPAEVRKKIASFKSIDHYIASGIWYETNGPDFIFRPQTYWLTNKDSRNEVAVDFVGRLETLDEDLSKIISQIEGTETTVAKSPVLNTTSGDESLSQESKSIIEDFYSRDFFFWGYAKDEG